MTDMPWHDYSPLMQAAVSAGDLAEFERLRVAAFAMPHIVRKDGMAYEANTRGHAYTAFGSADMMRQLANAGLKWDRPDYLDLAEECGRTNLTRWSKGGVLSDKGAWLHARTDMTERTLGGTLNKALIAVHAMAMTAEKFEMAGRDAFASALRHRGERFMEQLGDPSAWPNITSFVATKVDKRGRRKAVARSWLAYAVNWDTRDIYFLKATPAKNGMYAIKCMEMLAAIPTLLNVDMAKIAALEVDRSGRNIFSLFLKTCRIKEREGWYAPSHAAGNGNFDALSPERSPAPVIAPWLDTSIKRWA